MAFRFIFEIKVREGLEDAFIENWREGSMPIQEYEGAHGTRLHKKIGEEATFVAVAEWESQEHRKRAMADIKLGESERAKRVHAWKENEAFGDVTIIGQCIEIDSALPPDDSDLRKA
jgi:quinol monooxygenase YgiN